MGPHRAALFTWKAVAPYAQTSARREGVAPAFLTTAYRGYCDRHRPHNLPPPLTRLKAGYLVPYGGAPDWPCAHPSGCADHQVGTGRPLTNRKGRVRSTHHRHPDARLVPRADTQGRLVDPGCAAAEADGAVLVVHRPSASDGLVVHRLDALRTAVRPNRTRRFDGYGPLALAPDCSPAAPPTTPPTSRLPRTRPPRCARAGRDYGFPALHSRPRPALVGFGYGVDATPWICAPPCPPRPGVLLRNPRHNDEGPGPPCERWAGALVQLAYGKRQIARILTSGSW